MKNMTKALLALTAGIAFSTTANAAGTYGGIDFAFEPYVGAKAGAITLGDDTLDADPTGAIGVVAGYNIDKNFGTEVEYVSSVVDADYANGAGEYDINTMGVYATYRYDFPLNDMYAKAKIGYSKTDFEGSSKYENDSGSVAGGLAVGMQVSPELSVEGEYSMLPSDATEMLDANSMTVGVRMTF